VDGCSVGGGFGSVGGCIPSDIPYVGDAAFSDCALLEVNRSHFRGGNGAYPYQGAKPAVRIGNCTAAFVDCEFLGGDAEVCGAGQPIDGQPAAVVEGTSAVVFAGCTFIGGDGNPTGLALGNGGAGVRVDDVASADVRGSSVQVIAGGTSLSKFPPTSFQVPAVELLALGSATVSGVRVSPWPLPTSVTQPAPALPWIRFTGSVAPGGTAALEAFGPVGTSAIGALALQAALGSLPGLAPEPFWLAPAAIIAVFAPTLLGPEVPAPTSWVLPADPALAGVAVDAQVFAPQGHLTNPAVLVLRW
jgi:hypothetical protein